MSGTPCVPQTVGQTKIHQGITGIQGDRSFECDNAFFMFTCKDGDPALGKMCERVGVIPADTLRAVDAEWCSGVMIQNFTAGGIIVVQDKPNSAQNFAECRPGKGHGLHRAEIQCAIVTHQKHTRFREQRGFFKT